MENVKLLRGKPQKFIPIFIWSLSVTFPGYKNMFLGDYSGKIPHFISPLPSNPFLSCVSDRRRAEPSSWSGRKNVFLKLRWTQRSLHILPQLNSKAAPLHKLRLASLLKVYARKGLSFKFLKTFLFFSGGQHFTNIRIYSSPLAFVLPSKVHQICLYTSCIQSQSYFLQTVLLYYSKLYLSYLMEKEKEKRQKTKRTKGSKDRGPKLGKSSFKHHLSNLQ